MLYFLRSFFENTWGMVAEMSPYLILGFLISGLFYLAVRPESVQKLLGKPGLSAVVKSCLVGIPIPLCSCSVVPVAASLRKDGASRGATAAFISSTPQTGIDSIFATYSLMGGLFATVRVLVAFISGIAAGILIELFCNRKSSEEETDISKKKNDCCNKQVTKRAGLKQSLYYGFVKLPSELAVALIVGLLLAGLIATLLPTDLFEGSLGSGPAAFLIATLVGLPLYICATASIPMAYALITAGLSPGAALVFLIVGPATNTTTVVTIWKIIGRKATGIYLASLLIISWLAGWIFNAGISSQLVNEHVHLHETSASSIWQHVSGILLITILTFSLFSQKSRSIETECCSR